MLYLVQGLTLGFSAAVQPGPFQAYLLTQTLKLGGRRALPLALVPLLSDVPIVTLVLFALIQTPAWLLRGLQIAGGVFLIYLAYSAYRVARAVGAAPGTSSSAPRSPFAPRSFWQGVVINLLNPNPYLFWSLIGGPVILAAWALAPAMAFSFLAGFYLTLVGGTAAFILVFATAHRLDPRVTQALNVIAAAALLLFGLYQLWRGITGG